ncbi:hypothetical protein JCM10213v2_003501 [Rhodosporidiobolus nylandii]
MQVPTTPASLPFSGAYSQLGGSALPPSSQFPPPASSSTFVPSHNPRSSSLSSLSSFAYGGPGSNHSPHSSVSLPPAAQQASQHATQTNHTRVLLLRDFDAALKTKDLQEALSEWQDEPGGLKVKWRDDTSAWAVFGEPAVAKRAFLTLVTCPPSSLSGAIIEPYNAPDVPSILSAVANRPRSRSIAGQGATSGVTGGGHSRKSSLLGSGGGSALGAAIAGAQAAGPHGAGGSGSPSSAASGINGHHRTGSGSGSGSGSWQRSSFSRSGSGSALATSPLEGPDGRQSPETPGALTGGVIAGEAPRRFGSVGVNGASGHGRRGGAA